MSELARRIDLHNECNVFKKRIELLVIGKDTFLVDLVKSLKKITGEWRAWKHQVFGMGRSKPYVAAIEQVRELVNWSEETYSSNNKTLPNLKSAESYRKFTTETLKKFLQTCQTLEELRLEFNKKIFLPLKDFFNDDAANKYILKLDLLQMQWKQLLAPGAVNSGHFSLESAHFLKVAESHESFYCFYLVLRLIPDLCYKAEKCITLVRYCLDTDNAKAYNRERNFLLNVWLPEKQEYNKHVYNENITWHTIKEIGNRKSEIEKLDSQKNDLENRNARVLTDNERIRVNLIKMQTDLETTLKSKIESERKCKNLNENKDEIEKEISILLKEISEMKESMKKEINKRTADDDVTNEMDKQRSLLLEKIHLYEEKSLKLKEIEEKLDETEIWAIKEANKEANLAVGINNLNKKRNKNEKAIEDNESYIRQIDEESRHISKKLYIHSSKLRRLHKNNSN